MSCGSTQVSSLLNLKRNFHELEGYCKSLEKEQRRNKTLIKYNLELEITNDEMRFDMERQGTRLGEEKVKLQQELDADKAVTETIKQELAVARGVQNAEVRKAKEAEQRAELREKELKRAVEQADREKAIPEKALVKVG